MTGLSWSNITAGLDKDQSFASDIFLQSGVLVPFVPSRFTVADHVSIISSGEISAIIVGTKMGPYIAFSDEIMGCGCANMTWNRFGGKPPATITNIFPSTIVSQLKFDPVADTLLVSTMGRGCFTLSQATSHVACVWFQKSGNKLSDFCTDSVAPASSGMSALAIGAVIASCLLTFAAIVAVFNYRKQKSNVPLDSASLNLDTSYMQIESQM